MGSESSKSNTSYQSSYFSSENGKIINSYSPSCPVVFFEEEITDNNNQKNISLGFCPCMKLNISVACYGSSARIVITGEWINDTNISSDCIFAIPVHPNASVNSVSIKIGSERLLETVIVPQHEVKQIIQNAKNNDDINSSFREYLTDPSVFRLPFGRVTTNSIIKIKCDYIEELYSSARNCYALSIPLYFPPGTVIAGKTWNQLVNIKCKIMAPNITVTCDSHYITTKHRRKNSVIIKIDDCKPEQAYFARYQKGIGRYLELFYKIAAKQHIVSYSIRDENSNNLHLLIAPPEKINLTYSRAIFFVVQYLDLCDDFATRRIFSSILGAVDKVLSETLRPGDQFNVCIFDKYYQSSLIDAKTTNLQDCKAWINELRINSISAPYYYGYTEKFQDISIPINAALVSLEKSNHLPVMLLITDFSRDGQEIWNKIKIEQNSRTRFVTLGIGDYCNVHFLKMFSQFNTGLFHLESSTYHIDDTVCNLGHMTSTVVATDIEIKLYMGKQSLLVYGWCIEYCDKYIHMEIIKLIALFYGLDKRCLRHFKMNKQPYMTDLFLSHPMSCWIHCDNKNVSPDAVASYFIHPDGKTGKSSCRVKVCDDISFGKICITQQIKSLTMDLFFGKRLSVLKQITDISVESNIPSLFTAMVLFEAVNGQIKDCKTVDNIKTILANEDMKCYMYSKIQTRIKKTRKLKYINFGIGKYINKKSNKAD